MAYLDHAATTPMLPEAVEAMTAQLGRLGNASSLHASGRDARRVVEESRESVAEALGARPSDVVFTSGGTEADNLAVKGLYWARSQADPRRRRILASAVEHHAVLDPAAWLGEHEGAEVEWLPVDRTGRVRAETLREAIRRDPEDVALVSVMWANNEVGTVTDVRALADIAHSHDIPFHTDGVQALGQIPVDIGTAGVDAMTVTAHKLGGPVGAGALVAQRGLSLTPVLHGGGQERDVRSGTLDVAAIAGFATALCLAVDRQPERCRRLLELRARLVEGIRAAVPTAVLNGEDSFSPAARLPGNAHFSFPDCDGDALLLLLDARGIECSTGSACSAGVPRSSHVLLAMGLPESMARGSLRFSLGHTSTDADVDALLAAIGPVVDRATRAGRTGHARSA